MRDVSNVDSFILRKRGLLKFILFVGILMLCPRVQSQISLPHIFSNNMILQRNIEIPVWGTADPQQKVTVEMGKDIRVTTIADNEGNWKLHMPKMIAGGPHSMSIFGDDSTEAEINFSNILIGDVWLASGQSNMEWKVEDSKDAKNEIRNANYAQIRFFNVPHAKKIEKQEDTEGGAWKLCDSVHVKTFSAVAYYFSRELHQDLNVPIGIVQSTWGGTPVEAWTSRKQLLSSSVTRQRVLDNDSISVDHFVKDSLDLIRFWEIVYNSQNNAEKEIPKVKYNDSSWPTQEMPITMKDWDIPLYEGIVWLRKSIDVPKEIHGKDLTLNLGHPEMNYSVFFNEQEICKNQWNANLTHEYKIPVNIIKEKGNVIAIRMAFLWGGGGFNPPADEMYLTDGTDKISVAGSWKYNLDIETSIPKIHNFHRYPSYLYNGMIHPIIPYGIKGFIWYQGEDNVDDAADYSTVFPLMINDWRIRWKQGYLPFIYVQLANYMKIYDKPTESEWALLREGQSRTLMQPNTGMACIIDIGEENNIHPKNKQEVGRRLAVLARNMVYNDSVQAYGPTYKSHSINGNKITIEFAEIGEGLSVNNSLTLKGFAIAGKKQKFYWADAEIRGNKVIVSSDKVKSPVAVRYAWADNPVCNLINKNGLPAIPFRTDDW